MKAYTNIRELDAATENALAVFEALDVFMDAKWEDTLRRRAKERLAEAWFPWTKAYWRKHLASDNIVQRTGNYYNSPWNFYWANERLMMAQALRRRFLVASEELFSTQIVLDNEELDLLSSGVTLGRQILSGEKEC